MNEDRRVADAVSRLETQCPLLGESGALRCPRCDYETEFMDPLSIAPKYVMWLTPVRKCPECYHVFALLTDAATQLLSLYAHLA